MSYLSDRVSSHWSKIQANSPTKPSQSNCTISKGRAFQKAKTFLFNKGFIQSKNLSKILTASAILRYLGQSRFIGTKKEANKIINNFCVSQNLSPAKTKYKSKPKPYSITKSFYESDEWRALRYEALKTYGRKCMVCGSVPHPENKVRIHVDHIKPISKFPELKLSFDNLQILCEDCNLGKSNKDCIDYRQHHTESE